MGGEGEDTKGKEEWELESLAHTDVRIQVDHMQWWSLLPPAT